MLNPASQRGDSTSATHNVLMLLLPELGAFNSSFFVARQLSERGYHVTYLGPADFAEYVCLQGFSYSVIDAPKSAGHSDAGVRCLAWRRRYLFAFREYRDTLSFIGRWIEVNRPIGALVDPLMWRLTPPLLRFQIPIVNLNTTFASTFNTAAPPVFSHLAADDADNWLWRGIFRLAWIICLARSWITLAKDDLRLISIYGPFKYRRHQAKSLVRRNGGRLKWGEYGPRISAPELVMAPREFDFQCAPQSNRIYLGACVDDGRREGDLDWTGVDKTRRLAYCSLGTYSHLYRHGPHLFRTIIAALAQDVGWQAVIHVGDALDPEDLGPLPSHVVVRRAVPQLQLLRHADAFVTHGGLSSVREAIFQGVPMVVFPCRFDQPGNAARIVHHGLGVRGDISKVDAERLLTMLNQTQKDEFRHAIARMQRIFRQSNSAPDGMAWIKDFFGKTIFRPTAEGLNSAF